MSEVIKLTEQWGLRKLRLGLDRCEWALQYRGMDWIRMSEFLPSKNETSMDDDIHKFAEAVRALAAGKHDG